jgi:hypothetical protein
MNDKPEKIPSSVRYTVSHLWPLVEVGEERTESLLKLCCSPRLWDQRIDPRLDSAKLQVHLYISYYSRSNLRRTPNSSFFVPFTIPVAFFVYRSVILELYCLT